MMSGLGDVGGRLYRGEVSFNFVGRQRLWYMISGCILAVAIIALLVRGLNFSVDFKGGSIFEVNAPTATISQVQQGISNGGGGGSAIIQRVGSEWHAQTAPLTYAQSAKVQNALASALHVKAGDVSVQFVGPTWGTQISTKAIQALIAFLIVIVLYLSIAFEWKMATAAFVALLHDIVITIGVYALAGFQVSPATLIGLLTILGYSLYDTVVVFDKVRENTAGLMSGARTTYSQAANLALNQTLVRSINTSLIALLPVAAILVAGTALLGSGELSDLALVLFVGMLSGTYSSIFIATPVLADLKEREPQYKTLAKRVAARSASPRAAKRAARTEATVTAGGGAAVATGGEELEAGVAGDEAAEVHGDPAVGEAAAPETGRETAGDEAAADAGPGGTGRSSVPAGRASGSPRPGGAAARQQPRRTSAAQRRPGAKKKRR
jgi:preprotein translocase subunit SecF